jgi:hypothetical protein
LLQTDLDEKNNSTFLCVRILNLDDGKLINESAWKELASEGSHFGKWLA